MESYRKTGIIVGLLFIIATVTAIITIVFLGSTLEMPLDFNLISENEFQLVISVLFWIILAVSVMGIGAMMYPILKKYHEGLAAGYVVLRLTESILIIIASISILSLLSLSQEYLAGTLDVSYYQSLASMLLALQNWSFEIGTLIFLGLGGLFLYYPLYELRFVPRWLSGWGIIGAICVLLYGLLSLFGVADSMIVTLLAAPIAIQEMVFAVWLIFKGFNTEEIKLNS
ncbi:DUF4386 domain-containing protein [Thermoplasmatota archaeon]